MSSALVNLTSLQLYEVMMNQADDFFRFGMAILILFSLFGFGLFEVGVSRNPNIIMPTMLKTLLVSTGSIISFWLFGYALAFGGTNVFGGGQVYWGWSQMNSTNYAHFWLQFAYAALSASIAVGSLGERCHIATYIVFPFIWCGFAYPIVAHWIWHPNGWLYVGTIAWNAGTNGTTLSVPFFDASGSAVVNMSGGIAALVGAILLRPRFNRFYQSKVVEYKPYSSTLTTIGGSIMLIGMIVFNGTGIEFINYLNNNVLLTNGGNIVVPSNYLPFSYVAIALTNSVIAAAVGAFTVYFMQLIAKMPPNLAQVFSGALCALASISSSAIAVQPWAASVFGVFAGLGYLFWSWILLKLKVDDVINSYAIFTGGGMWGLIATAFLANINSYNGIVWSASTLSGYFLAWQIAGICAVWAWAGGCSLLIFGVLRLFKILRVREIDEQQNLDEVATSSVPPTAPGSAIATPSDLAYNLQPAPSQTGSIFLDNKSSGTLPRFAYSFS